MTPCVWCGGPTSIRHDTPHGHATWCPTVVAQSPLQHRRRVAATVTTLEAEPGRPPFDVDMAEVWRLYGFGYTYHEIADIMGVSRSTIRRRVTETR